MTQPFADLLAANDDHVRSFGLRGMTAPAKRHLAVVTCMDSRIDPLAILGLAPGDAKVLRNPGARVTDETLRALVLAVHLLDVQRVLVMAHTDCAMNQPSDTELHARIQQSAGIDTSSLAFGTAADQAATLRADVARIADYEFLSAELAVAGGIYDLGTGRLSLVTDAVS